MNSRRTEILIGAAVLLAGVLLVGSVYAAKQAGGDDGYTVRARFQRADGLGVGAQVRLAGMPVGAVVGQRLDEKFRAVVTLRLERAVRLSRDTAAIIQTDGLLGPKYIALQPGGDEREIGPGGEIAYTQDALVIEDLLQTIISEAKSRRADAPGTQAQQ